MVRSTVAGWVGVGVGATLGVAVPSHVNILGRPKGNLPQTGHQPVELIELELSRTTSFRVFLPTHLERHPSSIAEFTPCFACLHQIQALIQKDNPPFKPWLMEVAHCAMKNQIKLLANYPWAEHLPSVLQTPFLTTLHVNADTLVYFDLTPGFECTSLWFVVACFWAVCSECVWLLQIFPAHGWDRGWGFLQWEFVTLSDVWLHSVTPQP